MEEVEKVDVWCHHNESGEPLALSTRFEIFLRSSPEGENQPFPECSWNECEKRWEWSCALVTTLLGLSKGLGCPLLIHPLATTEGDLDVLEICDVEVETTAEWSGP